MAREEIQSEVTGTVWKIEMKVGDDVADGDVALASSHGDHRRGGGGA